MNVGMRESHSVKCTNRQTNSQTDLARAGEGERVKQAGESSESVRELSSNFQNWSVQPALKNCAAAAVAINTTHECDGANANRKIIIINLLSESVLLPLLCVLLVVLLLA